MYCSSQGFRFWLHVHMTNSGIQMCACLCWKELCDRHYHAVCRWRTQSQLKLMPSLAPIPAVLQMQLCSKGRHLETHGTAFSTHIPLGNSDIEPTSTLTDAVRWVQSMAHLSSEAEYKAVWNENKLNKMDSEASVPSLTLAYPWLYLHVNIIFMANLLVGNWYVAQLMRGCLDIVQLVFILRVGRWGIRYIYACDNISMIIWNTTGCFHEQIHDGTNTRSMCMHSHNLQQGGLQGHEPIFAT